MRISPVGTRRGFIQNSAPAERSAELDRFESSPTAPIKEVLPQVAPLDTRPVQACQITVVSDMIVDRWTEGEWGFGALVELIDADGHYHKILFDTGAQAHTTLENTETLAAPKKKIWSSPNPEGHRRVITEWDKKQTLDLLGRPLSLEGVTDVVLSHNHQDHVMGLAPLRRHGLLEWGEESFATAWVGSNEIFYPRPVPGGGEDNVMVMEKDIYREWGGEFEVVGERPRNLHPGLWLTGKVPRTTGERNWSDEIPIQNPFTGKEEPDTIPESQALVINTREGQVILTGCGHAGVVNIMNYVEECGQDNLHALLGGMHLFRLDRENIEWTAEQVGDKGVAFFLGAHCTGLEAIKAVESQLMTCCPGGAANVAISTVGTQFVHDEEGSRILTSLLTTKPPDPSKLTCCSH